MNTLKAHYQHAIPDPSHAVKWDRNVPNRKRKCLTCGKAITWVQADEGPESIKALLRF